MRVVHCHTLPAHLVCVTFEAMSTGTLKKPSRPPPPPPIHHDSYSFNTHHLSNSSSSSSSATFASHKKSSSRLSDYIKISDCHTGLPDRHHQLGASPFDNQKMPAGIGLAGFKNRTSTSFSSATLKPSTNLFSAGASSPLANYNQYPSAGQTLQTNHQKSRSLTENHLNPSSYDLPPYEAQHNGNRGNKHHSSTRYSSNISAFSSGNNHHEKNFTCGHRYFKQQQVDNRKSASSMSPATVYKTVDFLKTEALTKCKVERTSGRGSDFNRLLVSSNQRKS